MKAAREHCQVKPYMRQIASEQTLVRVFGQLGFAYDGDVLYIRSLNPCDNRGHVERMHVDRAALERSRFRVARQLRARAMGWPVVPVDVTPLRGYKKTSAYYTEAGIARRKRRIPRKLNG